MIVIKVNKDMTTDECLEHAKKLTQAYGERVLVIDRKVDYVEILNNSDEYKNQGGIRHE